MSEDFLANNNSLHCDIHLKIEESCENEEPQVHELEKSNTSLNHSLNSVDTNIQTNVAENWKFQGESVLQLTDVRSLKSPFAKRNSKNCDYIENQDPLPVVIPLRSKNDASKKINVKKPYENSGIGEKKDKSSPRHPTRHDLYKIVRMKHPELEISLETANAVRKALMYLLDLEESHLKENEKGQIDEIVNNFCKFFNDPIIIDSTQGTKEVNEDFVKNVS